MASAVLPDDILHLLCETLADQEQFGVLFNCACASKSFAAPALTNLYRAHHKAPIRGADQDEVAFERSMRFVMVQRWSILWKSIIASAVDASLFPYCRYIKELDFRDLENLIEDEQFSGKISKQFFKGPLKPFHKYETLTRPNGKQYERLNVKSIVNAIGEVVTQHTPMLETISGQLSSTALIDWTPRIPRLQELDLWDGGALENELVATKLHEHCPKFNSLMIYHWLDIDRDDKFAKFLSALRPNTLQRLNTLNNIGASKSSFQALAAHGESLKNLWICVDRDSMPQLTLLENCNALEEVRIEDVHSTHIHEETQAEVCSGITKWLRSCPKLYRLNFGGLPSAPTIVTPLLVDRTIRLRMLEVDAYVLKDSRQFHQALGNQTSLTFLSLTGDTDGMVRDDVDAIVDSLKQLTNMQTLRLLLQEVFAEHHLIALLQNLTQLNEVYVSGLELTDKLLEPIGNLQNLRSITMAGISKFTMDGLGRLFKRLGPGNQGFRVLIDMADPDTAISDDELTYLTQMLTDLAGGTMDYTLWRDPYVSEFEGESD